MQDLVIYQRMYDFMLYLFPVVDRFPRSERFALCSNIKDCCIGIARMIVRANKARNIRRQMQRKSGKQLSTRIASWLGHAKRINAQQAVINILQESACTTTTT